MEVKIRGDEDTILRSVKLAMESDRDRNSGARIDLYRQNSFSIRIRVIDPGFAVLEKSERHERFRESLRTLPDEILGDISMIVLLAPGEESHSLANLEFEEPSPSLVQ